MYRKSSSESRLLLMASYSCCLTSVVTVTMVHLLRFQPCFAFIGRHPYRNDRRTAFSSTSSTFPSHLSNSKGTFSEPLIPETNPYANTSAISLAGVSHSQVLDAIHRLYPPQRLDERNAMSRTDGYWPFIQKGGDAPKQFTYGEFDFYFFAQLLDHARKYYETSDEGEKSNTWDDKVFVDIGSGTGRLVFSAAALHPGLRCSRGIEVLPNIHQTAMDNLLLCRSVRQDALVEEESHDKEIDTETKECPDADSRSEHEDREGETVNYNDFRYEYSLEEENDDENKREHRKLILSAMDFVCGSFEDPYVYLGDADCIFCFSSCMPPEMIDSLAVSIGRQCRYV